jgi:quinol monooxygenase YgiN
LDLNERERNCLDPRHRRHHRQTGQARRDPTKWGPDTFLVIEKWESIEALKAHAAAPHVAAYGAKIWSNTLKQSRGN